MTFYIVDGSDFTILPILFLTVSLISKGSKIDLSALSVPIEFLPSNITEVSSDFGLKIAKLLAASTSDKGTDPLNLTT